MFMKHFANSNLRFFSDLISTSAVKNHRLSLLLLMLFTLLLLPANMVAQTAETAYAVFDHDTGTLTFKYGDKPAEGAFELNQDEETPNWKEFQNDITKVVFDESFKQARPTTCFKWFENCSNLETIEYLQYLNTSKVTDMAYMFNGCSKLASLALSNFNTEKVQHMKFMFADCLNLTKLDLSNFNTANVRNMYSMFNDCQNLTSLDLSNFNTAKVTNMNNMFYNCRNLTSLILSNFNTKEVTNMANMFELCQNLTSLDLSSFNTCKVTDMRNMFEKCGNLASLDISNFNTWKVENMKFMFALCTKLKTIYSNHFDLNSKLASDRMFDQCYLLKGVIGYESNVKNATGANYKTGYFTKLVGKNGSEKIGATGKHLTVARLDLTDDKDFVANDEPFTVKVASYSRTMKEGTTWGTLCLPFEVSLEGKNFRAFKLLSVDEGTGTVELKEIEKIIAPGAPVIIKMNNGETNLNFTVENNDIAITPQDTDGKYQLQGLYTQKVFSDTDNYCYIVKGGKLMNPAKMLEKSKATKVVSKPFRAYMVDNSSAPDTGAKMFSIGISDSATAIDTLNAIANDKAEYFDLQGHRLNEPQKGINIVKRNGKTMKVIIK